MLEAHISNLGQIMLQGWCNYPQTKHYKAKKLININRRRDSNMLRYGSEVKAPKTLNDNQEENIDKKLICL